MRKTAEYYGIMLFAILSLTMAGHAEVLVVLNDSTSEWAETAVKEGDTLQYTASGKKKRISLDRVSQLLPRPKRGKTYDEPTITKMVIAVEKQMRKHKALRKRLQLLRDEWKARRRVTKDLGPQIEELEKTYHSSSRNLAAYNSFSSNLGMLRFQDLSATHTVQFDEVEQRIRVEFLASQRKVLAGLLKIANPEPAQYMVARELSSVLKSHDALPPVAPKLLGKMRLNTLRGSASRAAKRLKAAPSLTGYLLAHEIWLDLEQHLGESEKELAMIRNKLDALRRDLPKIDKAFVADSSGFPLSKEDLAALRSGQGKFPTRTGDLEVPSARIIPGVTKADASGVHAKLAIVFRVPPPEGDYRLRLAVPSKETIKTTSVPISGAIHRYSVAVKCSGKDLRDAGFQGDVYVELVREGDQGKWQPVSKQTFLAFVSKPEHEH